MTDVENNNDNDWNEEQRQIYKALFKAIEGIKFVKVNEEILKKQPKFEVNPSIVNKWEKQMEV